jgi:hypothetical protein
MCFSSGSSKAPKPQPPTTFNYLPSNQSDVQRQAAAYEAKGYTNTASYGSELASAPAQPAQPATTGGL